MIKADKISTALLTMNINRGYSTQLKRHGMVPPVVNRKKRSLNKEVGTLEDFLLRNQALAVYRNILRSLYKIPDASVRKELITFTKEEYKASSNVKDIDLKRTLVTGAIRQFKSLTANLGLSLPGIKL